MKLAIGLAVLVSKVALERNGFFLRVTSPMIGN
jgi:hypothetical protein